MDKARCTTPVSVILWHLNRLSSKRGENDYSDKSTVKCLYFELALSPKVSKPAIKSFKVVFFTLKVLYYF